MSCLFGLVITSPLIANEEKNSTQRISTGLQAFYDFRGEGPIIRDRSETGKSLDLRIGEMTSVRRERGSIEILGEANIVSQTAATMITQAAKRSGELTIEAWIQPSQKDQSGPARIVTLSQDSSQRNFTLGQDGSKYDVRFRSKNSSTNGLPSLASTGGTARAGRLTHVAYTRSRNGQARVYVDGKASGRVTQTGGLNNWNESFKLGIGDEISGGRVWQGTLHLVAVYSRALSNGEIRRNFAAGENAGIGNSDATGDALASAQHRRAAFFETKVAPLLSQHCLECHDAAAHEGGLNLSRKAPAFTGGESGKVLVPGDSSDSLLWTSVADDEMPHDREPLTNEQKQILKQWIDDGAHWTVDYVDPAIYRSVKESENWIQRLTIPEYIESVRSTLGVDIAEEAWRRLPRDKRADGFRNTAYNLNVDLKHIEAYARLAEIIVAQIDTTEFARRFSKSRKLTDNNMRDLIRDMGKWVLRGPLDEREVVLYRGVSTTVASAGGDFREAVGMVLEAMLQSPKFIYRIENQVGDGTWWPVDEYELANRISYIVWGAPPDEKLLQAADQGDLSYSDTLLPHLDRMMQDPRAKQRSDEFVVQWLNLDRLRDLQPNREKFPQWSPELAADMRAETLEFFRDVVWKKRAPLANLLDSQFSYMSPQLARHYGIEPQGEDFVRYDLNEIPSRGGLLTHGSVLTIGGDNASMVTRGLFVLNDLLFSEVGDPPPGLDTTPVPTSPGKTHRAIAMERVKSESCGGCHSRFEPLAYGLEKFDGLGAFHERDEHGNRLREDGEILFPGDATPTPYKTAAELMKLLADSKRVNQCLTRKVTQFAIGRPLVASDARIVREIQAAAEERGGTYQNIVTAIVLSDLVQKTRTEPRE
ncbi:MAG: DUF1592 domain-containing protein [Rubripirellula sp.]|nr:DUF1592 domain-containing protein [Rubripirellula sp.]